MSTIMLIQPILSGEIPVSGNHSMHMKSSSSIGMNANIKCWLVPFNLHSVVARDNQRIFVTVINCQYKSMEK